jgi:hypothetical protein
MFAMAYGGNGITYSLLGATLLRALIEKRPHPLAALYSAIKARARSAGKPRTCSTKASKPVTRRARQRASRCAS